MITIFTIILGLAFHYKIVSIPRRRIQEPFIGIALTAGWICCLFGAGFAISPPEHQIAIMSGVALMMVGLALDGFACLFANGTAE